MNPEWFAGRLKQLREAAGLTQQQFAEKCGMNKFGIAKLEQGVTLPGWDTVIAICKVLGVTCEAFLQPPAEEATVKTMGRPRKPESQEPAAEAPPAVKKAKSKKKGKGS